jgi:hypothetical protein
VSSLANVFVVCLELVLATVVAVPKGIIPNRATTMFLHGCTRRASWTGEILHLILV